MLVRLCLSVLVVVGVEKGLCLRCYSCISTENETCIKLDKNLIPLNHCGIQELKNTERYASQIHSSLRKLYEVDATQEPQLSFNCLKQQTKKGNKHIVLRGCQLAPSDQLDICVQVKKKNSDLILTDHCSLCSGDGCNAAPLRRPLLALTGMVSFAFLLLS